MNGEQRGTAGPGLAKWIQKAKERILSASRLVKAVTGRETVGPSGSRRGKPPI